MKNPIKILGNLAQQVIVGFVMGALGVMWSNVLVLVFERIYDSFSLPVWEGYWFIWVAAIGLGITHGIVFYKKNIIFLKSLSSFPLIGSSMFLIVGLIDHKLIMVGENEARTTGGVLLQFGCFSVGLVEFSVLFLIWAAYLVGEAVAVARTN
jgi:hypothetical protein